MGRFSSPDPSGLYYADPTNPQSFNLYAYVQNNPLVNIDPDGLACIYIDPNTGVFQRATNGDCDNSTTASANAGNYVDGNITNLTVRTTTGDLSGQVTGWTGTGTDDSGNIETFNGSTGISQQINTDGSGGIYSMDQNDRIQQLGIGVTQDTNHSVGCIAQAYGIAGAGNGAAAVLGAPIVPKRFAAWKASQGTSLLSPLRKLYAGAPMPGKNYATPTGGLFSNGKPFEMGTTANAGAAVARWAPYAISGITTTVASYKLWKCLGD
jgi:hypothetical protein